MVQRQPGDELSKTRTILQPLILGKQPEQNAVLPLSTEATQFSRAQLTDAQFPPLYFKGTLCPNEASN